MDQRGHGVVSPEQMVDLMEIVIHQASDLPPVVLCSPLNPRQVHVGKAELADSMSWWVGDRFDVYVDALKAKELDRLSKPWTWPTLNNSRPSTLHRGLHDGEAERGGRAVQVPSSPLPLCKILLRAPCGKREQRSPRARGFPPIVTVQHYRASPIHRRRARYRRRAA